MNRFLSRVLPLLLSFGLIFNCTGCSTVLVLAGKARENSEASSSVISESSASSGVISTPVPTEDGDLRAFYTDVANAESVTVMVYMIGSDLESEDGSATDDLLEMADAALSENVHLVLQTGGTYPRTVLCLYVHESRQAWPRSCLQYHVGDYRRIDDGAIYDSVVFGRRHHRRAFHVRKGCLP